MARAIFYAILWLMVTNWPVLGDDKTVIAKLMNREITLGDIKAKVAAIPGQLNSQQEAQVFAEVLQSLLDQVLLEAQISKTNSEPSEEELRRATDALTKQLQAKNPTMTLEKYAKATNQTTTNIYNQIRFRLGLQKMLVASQGLETIEQFYQEHQTEFDGSELRVSHILLRPLSSGNFEDLSKLIRQAQSIREEILSGKLTFAEAAKKYSSGPSRDQGGDLGWIKRDGPMVEAFNRGAYTLKKDDGSEVSEPVVSNFGVHLITRTGSKPGTRRFEEIREQVQPLYMQQLSEKLLKQLRSDVKPEINELIPHYRWGTKELVIPR
jgi:parvulin-like peptidyl-prolyl isomerase